jgi:hypothetical protein
METTGPIVRFTVLWKPGAEADLASIWTNAPDRASVASAADQVLANQPQFQGESRAGATRVLIEPPLGAHFHVSEEDRQVFVLHVWRAIPSSESAQAESRS